MHNPVDHHNIAALNVLMFDMLFRYLVRGNVWLTLSTVMNPDVCILVVVFGVGFPDR